MLLPSSDKPGVSIFLHIFFCDPVIGEQEQVVVRCWWQSGTCTLPLPPIYSHFVYQCVLRVVCMCAQVCVCARLSCVCDRAVLNGLPFGRATVTL